MSTPREIEASAPTVLELPMARAKRETTDPWKSGKHSAVQNPWVDPPDVTPEMEALADAWDEGGRDLIAEVELDDEVTVFPGRFTFAGLTYEHPIPGVTHCESCGVMFGSKHADGCGRQTRMGCGCLNHPNGACAWSNQ